MERLVLTSLTIDELQQMIYDAVVKAISGQQVKPADDMIDRSELMQITGISSYTTVIAYEKLGVFKPVRLGKKLLYRRSEVLEAMKHFQRI